MARDYFVHKYNEYDKRFSFVIFVTFVDKDILIMWRDILICLRNEREIGLKS